MNPNQHMHYTSWIISTNVAISDTITLLKHIDKTTLLIPYEQLYIQSYHQHKRLIPEQPNLSADLQPKQYTTSHLASRSILQHQHDKKKVPSRSCQLPVNINCMLSKFTLRKNLLHFLKYFYYLIHFNIIWHFTNNNMFYAFNDNVYAL
jgi:hypothetical protein